MTDKQRADHIAAKYWNGFITRTEAQKVFDEHANVVTNLARTVQGLDAVIAYIADKFGITADEITAWVKAKSEAANNSSNNQSVPGERNVPEPERTAEAASVPGNVAEELPV